MIRSFFITALLFMAVACSKSNTFDEVYPPEPVIRLVSISPTKMQEFSDSLVVVIRYQDGDGDLGFTHPDSNALEVQDARLVRPDYYFVPPLAPLNSTLSITGELRFGIRGAFVLGSNNEENTSFTIRIKDRAGNWSNTITTQEITINK